MRQSFSSLSIVALGAVAAFVIWQASRAGENDVAVRPAAASSGAGVEAAADVVAGGDVLLDSAVTTLESHASIAARVRIQVDLFGHQLFGPGEYLQQGRGETPKFRFELALQTTNGKIALSHVGDGDRLWLFEDFGTGGELSYVDLATLREQIRNVEPGAAPPRQDLLTGGLPKLLTSLQTNFQFADATQVQRNGVPVWRLQGAWRPERLAALLGNDNDDAKLDDKQDAAKKNTAKKLPMQMPSDVVLYLDGRTLFPLRFEFYRQPNSDKSSAPKPLLAMELFEQRFDVPIDDSQFQRPSDLLPKDVTEKFLERLRAAEPR